MHADDMKLRTVLLKLRLRNLMKQNNDKSLKSGKSADRFDLEIKRLCMEIGEHDWEVAEGLDGTKRCKVCGTLYFENKLKNLESWMQDYHSKQY